MIVLVKDAGVLGYVTRCYNSGAMQVVYYDYGIKFIVTLEEDEYIKFEELGEE